MVISAGLRARRDGGINLPHTKLDQYGPGWFNSRPVSYQTACDFGYCGSLTLPGINWPVRNAC